MPVSLLSTGGSLCWCTALKKDALQGPVAPVELPGGDALRFLVERIVHMGRDRHPRCVASRILKCPGKRLFPAIFPAPGSSPTSSLPDPSLPESSVRASSNGLPHSG
jgi:hypothetical protein